MKTLQCEMLKSETLEGRHARVAYCVLRDCRRFVGAAERGGLGGAMLRAPVVEWQRRNRGRAGRRNGEGGQKCGTRSVECEMENIEPRCEEMTNY